MPTPLGWRLVKLLAPPRTPAWTPGTLRLAQTLRQRAFTQRYKLDVSVSFAKDGAIEIALRIEPAPRVHGLETPASFARIAEAMSRLGYAGEWDPNPGHAAANGTWRRALADLAEAGEEVAFVQDLGAAMEDESQRRPLAKAFANRRALSGWPLIEALRETRIGDLSPLASEFARSAIARVDGRRCTVELLISTLGDTMYKSATSDTEAAVRMAIGRAKGEWITTEGARFYLVSAPLRSLDVAARFVADTDHFEPVASVHL